MALRLKLIYSSFPLSRVVFVICWGWITVQHRVISQCWPAFSKQRFTLLIAAGGQRLYQWIVTSGLLLPLPLPFPEPLVLVGESCCPSAQKGAQSMEEVSEVLQFWLRLCHITRILPPAAWLSYSTSFPLTYASASWFVFDQVIQV